VILRVLINKRAIFLNKRGMEFYDTVFRDQRFSQPKEKTPIIGVFLNWCGVFVFFLFFLQALLSEECEILYMN
jgi:hypothetical protein